ncbi:MAG: c-type cytochrome domain-containing protein [Cyclobacteriaceae bacterium]
MKKAAYVWIPTFLGLLILSCKHDPNFPIVDLTEQTGIDKACDPSIIYFEKDVLPLLLSSCAYAGCHDSKTAEDGVILDNYENTIRTGDVDPFNPGNSELYEVLFERGDDQMPPPPDAALTQEEKDLIRDWIGQGAKNFTCASCDTAVFTLTAAVQPMMDSYCMRCHNDSRSDGGVSLQGYAKIKATIDDGSLWGTLTNTGGFPLMPQGAPIPDCELDQVRKWIEKGAQND